MVSSEAPTDLLSSVLVTDRLCLVYHDSSSTYLILLNCTSMHHSRPVVAIRPLKFIYRQFQSFSILLSNYHTYATGAHIVKFYSSSIHVSMDIHTSNVMEQTFLHVLSEYTYIYF